MCVKNGGLAGIFDDGRGNPPNTCGIGVDIEDISRFEKLNPLNDDQFLKKIFTETEIKYCLSKHNKAQHFAARFGGKEAVIKALSDMGIQNINYNSIEIINDQNGVPKVTIKNAGISNIRINISLSHSKDMAIAFAIAQELNCDE